MTKFCHLPFSKFGRSLFSFFLFICLSRYSFAQNIDAIINAGEVERIEKTLSSDDMQGRRSFSPGLEKAADFIADEFKAAGLKPFGQGDSFRQTFTMIKAKTISTVGGVGW